MPETDQEQLAATLAAVREAALACTACKLHRDRTQVVFGQGSLETPMLLAGQSPGEQEDREGSPFVGRAGQLLTECLSAVRIRREHIWITNIVKCRPWTRTEGGRGRNRDPEPDEVEACRAWIDAELALIRPRVIVCLGAQSAELVLGRAVSITRERGRWFDEHPYRPARVMPVLHPAFLLRKHGAEFEELKRQLSADLDTARAMAARLRGRPRAVQSEAAGPAPVQRSLFEIEE